MATYYVSLVAAILFGIAGQITLKSGALNSASVAAQFVNPLTIVGLAIYAVAALCYVVALKKIPVSVAFPSVAASYAIVAVIAHLLWNAVRRSVLDRQRHRAAQSLLTGITDRHY